MDDGAGQDLKPTPLRTPGLALSDASRLVRKYFEQRARSTQLGLTRPQATLLANLARAEGINQATLAALMEIEPITLARMIDRLEASGLVERRRDPADRRAWILFLTPKAHPLIERIRELADQVWDTAMAGLSPVQCEAFRAALVTIKANLAAEIGCVPVSAPEDGAEEETMRGAAS
ncbi:MAG TPA: MarR family transcriptional regulator [Stellaceae bacterium]|jgi:DNA-binding MarR family transcriptional regulator|nr:MarR family transcriptional regulator [Stellaceae bacterium]